MKIKLFGRKIREQFGLLAPDKHPDCSQFEIDNGLLSRFAVERLLPVVGYAPFPLPELVLMAGAVCRIKPSHIFEWGTNVGKSARVFSETCRHFGIKAQTHSVDLPDDVSHNEHPGSRRGQLVRGIGNVVLHQGDGVSTALSLAKPLPPEARLLFFLDGDHSYESVHRELTSILRERPSASILVHDTFFQSAQANYNIGPNRAVETITSQMKLRHQRISTETGLPGMTLLYFNEAKYVAK